MKINLITEEQLKSFETTLLKTLEAINEVKTALTGKDSVDDKILRGIKGLAKEFGWSEPTARKYIKLYNIPGKRAGGKIIFFKSQVEAALPDFNKTSKRCPQRENQKPME